MLSGFSKISKSLHEHTIGSAINITTRAYNVCADSDFVFDARPIAYPSFSRFMPIRANSRYMYMYIYIYAAVCSVFRLHYLFRAIAPSCLQEKFDTRADFYFLEIFMPFLVFSIRPTPFFFLSLFRYGTRLWLFPRVSSGLHASFLFERIRVIFARRRVIGRMCSFRFSV